MKNISRYAIAGCLLFCLLGGSASAQLKVATVDLKKVFENYYKRKQAEAHLKDRQADMEKEDNNLKEDYKKGGEEYRALLAGANDQTLSQEERDKRKRQAEDKYKQLKDLEVTIAQYEKTAITTLQEQQDRMRNNIIAEIRNVVNAKAKAGGFNLVLDTAAESANKTPVFLYSSTENDLTEAVLVQLNQSAPSDLLRSDDKPAADDKKKDSKK